MTDHRIHIHDIHRHVKAPSPSSDIHEEVGTQKPPPRACSWKSGSGWGPSAAPVNKQGPSFILSASFCPPSVIAPHRRHTSRQARTERAAAVSPRRWGEPFWANPLRFRRYTVAGSNQSLSSAAENVHLTLAGPPVLMSTRAIKV